MQMLCKVSAGFGDVTCPECGQSFLVYWTNVAGKSRNELKDNLVAGLRQQHTTVASSAAHAPAFNLPARKVEVRRPESVPARMPALIGVYS